jgi:hypothetical protein
LAVANRLRRSYYELLRDDLDQFLLRYALVDSYHQFVDRGIPYPWVERRELKPRARIPNREYDAHNVFLVLFVEDPLPAVHKKYIRFLDVNKTTKSNLLHTGHFPLKEGFDRSLKSIDSVHFFDFVRDLLPIDYALLIQRDPATGTRDRYSLTHFHVRIDWPIADAAEDLARNLRYISKDLYEKGDKHAEDLQKKLFEYYGVPVMVGGRRTAAVVGAQYLRRLSCIPTLYVSSSESRALIRFSERGTAKTILRRFSREDANHIAETHHLNPATFRKQYVVARDRGFSICLFKTTYDFADPARPPEDGKLRELKPDLNFLTVGGQHLLPRPGVRRFPPLPVNLIYA